MLDVLDGRIELSNLDNGSLLFSSKRNDFRIVDHGYKI